MSTYCDATWSILEPIPQFFNFSNLIENEDFRETVVELLQVLEQPA